MGEHPRTFADRAVLACRDAPSANAAGATGRRTPLEASRIQDRNRDSLRTYEKPWLSHSAKARLSLQAFDSGTTAPTLPTSSATRFNRPTSVMTFCCKSPNKISTNTSSSQSRGLHHSHPRPPVGGAGGDGLDPALSRFRRAPRINLRLPQRRQRILHHGPAVRGAGPHLCHLAGRQP